MAKYHIIAGDFAAGVVTGESSRDYPSLRAAVADARSNELECLARDARCLRGRHERSLIVRGPRAEWRGSVSVTVS